MIKSKFSLVVGLCAFSFFGVVSPSAVAQTETSQEVSDDNSGDMSTAIALLASSSLATIFILARLSSSARYSGPKEFEGRRGPRTSY